MKLISDCQTACLNEIGGFLMLISKQVLENADYILLSSSRCYSEEPIPA